MAEEGVAADKKGAQRRGATIVFVDEGGFSERPSVRRTWALRGQTPVVRDSLSWHKLSGIGAVAWRPGQAETRIFLSLREGSIDSPEAIGFLRHMRRHLRGPVVVVWDRLAAHRSQATKEYVASQREWLRVEYLPGYAPELNPVEYLWANLDGQELANYSADDLGALAQAIERGKRRMRRRDVGLSFIKHAGLLTQRRFTQLRKTQ